MNQYLRSVHNEASGNVKSLISILSCEFGFFVFGFALALILTAGSGDGATVPLGTLMAAMMAFLFTMITVAMNFCTGFEYAVKMGVTRKAYMAGSLMVSYVQAVLAMLALWLLSAFEPWIDGILFPGVVQELDIFTRLSLPVCLLIPLLVVPVASFMGAAVEKWGKKAFWILYVIIFVPLVFSSQIGNIVSTRDTSTVVSRLVVTVWDALSALPALGLKALIAVVPVLCLLFTYLLLRRQSVNH